VPLERLWAGWRGEYVGSTGGGDDSDSGCVFCRIFASGEPDSATFVVWRGARCAALLNAFPYTSGHLLVMPTRHVGELDDLDDEESTELWAGARQAVTALRAAYSPEGVNLGANLGQAAGAGVPGHLHLHALPRWNGDTNFMTSVAEARVIPEALPATWEKLRAAWPMS
jgi:ATP adenylyltransferase